MAAGAASATSLESPKIPMMVGFGLEVVCKVFYGVKKLRLVGLLAFPVLSYLQYYWFITITGWQNIKFKGAEEHKRIISQIFLLLTYSSVVLKWSSSIVE